MYFGDTCPGEHVDHVALVICVTALGRMRHQPCTSKAMKRIPTKYRHLFNADGTRRTERCPGHLEIVCDTSGVFVCCSECGEGYRFQFIMRRSDELANGADDYRQ